MCVCVCVCKKMVKRKFSEFLGKYSGTSAAAEAQRASEACGDEENPRDADEVEVEEDEGEDVGDEEDEKKAAQCPPQPNGAEHPACWEAASVLHDDLEVCNIVFL